MFLQVKLEDGKTVPVLANQKTSIKNKKTTKKKSGESTHGTNADSTARYRCDLSTLDLGQDVWLEIYCEKEDKWIGKL